MIKDDEFLRIAVYMKEHYGIDLRQKKVFVNGRLENYMKRGGWESFHDFMDDLQKDETGKFEKELVNFLTTNYTYFMREFQHFEFFKREVLPWAKNKAGKTKDLRVWCGAASTGEEPYMIAMVIRDFFRVGFWRMGYNSSRDGCIDKSAQPGNNGRLPRGGACANAASVEKAFLSRCWKWYVCGNGGAKAGNLIPAV